MSESRQNNKWLALTVKAKTPCNTITVIANYNEDDLELYQTHIYVQEVDTVLFELISELFERLKDLKINDKRILEIKEAIEDYAMSFDKRSCHQCLLETISRLISLCLKHKIPLSQIFDELRGMRCNASPPRSIGKMNISCPHAIYNALKRLGKTYREPNVNR